MSAHDSNPFSLALCSFVPRLLLSLCCRVFVCMLSVFRMKSPLYKLSVLLPQNEAVNDCDDAMTEAPQ